MSRAGLGNLPLAVAQLGMRLESVVVVHLEQDAVDAGGGELRQLLFELRQAGIVVVADEVDCPPGMIGRGRYGSLGRRAGQVDGGQRQTLDEAP